MGKKNGCQNGITRTTNEENRKLIRGDYIAMNYVRAGFTIICGVLLIFNIWFPENMGTGYKVITSLWLASMCIIVSNKMIKDEL